MTENRSKSAVCSTQLEEAVGQHQQVPVGTGTCGMPELAVAKTEVLLGVSEKCLDAPSHRVQLDEMACGRVYLVRHDVLHARFVVLVIATSSLFVISNFTSPRRPTSRFCVQMW